MCVSHAIHPIYIYILYTAEHRLTCRSAFCAESRARTPRRFSTRPVYRVIRLCMDLFVSFFLPPEDVRLVLYCILTAIRREIADRVPFTSDRTFYTCVIYISPRNWVDTVAHTGRRRDRAAARLRLFNELCTYTFEHAVVKFIWTMSKCVCLSPCCQSINKNKEIL